MEISLKLNNEADLLNLKDLLLPLNYFNNFIFELENLRILDRKFEKESNIAILYNENGIDRFFPMVNTIRGKESYISLKKISKSSPTFIELLLTVAPYVEETIRLLVEAKEIDIENKIYELLNKKESFNNLSESKKRAIIRYILLFFRLLLGYLTITINR
jgi:hypothetical protein